MNNAKKNALGKGLGALIREGGNESPNQVLMLDITKIEPNKQQPRTYFDTEKLEELAESIKEFGIIQPVVVRKDGDFYRLVAGERRWRAARIAKLKMIPAILKDYNEHETIQVALLENIQRADLNPIEEASGYKRLIDEFEMTHEMLAEKLGKSRSTITNALRLMQLDYRIHPFLAAGKITTGHAKALLSIENTEENKNLQLHFCEKIMEEELSVRETERLIREYQKPKKEKEVREYKNFKPLESELSGVLGVKVSIKNPAKKDGGKIEIEYATAQELDRLFLLIRNMKAGNNVG